MAKEALLKDFFSSDPDIVEFQVMPNIISNIGVGKCISPREFLNVVPDSLGT
jgi:hypothetical protein